MSKNEKRVYYGYAATNTKCGSQGIYHFELDAEKETLKILDTTQILNADYIVLSKDEKFLYAAQELVYFKGKATAGAAAFRIASDGSLIFLNSRNTKSQMACFCCTDSKGQNFYTSEYMGGYVTVFDIDIDGSLSDYKYALGHEPRQGCHWPSAHSVIVTPDDRYILVTNVGLDIVSLYDRKNEYACVTEVAAHGRPRQAVFSPDGKYVYVSTEQSGEVYVYAYCPEEEEKLKRLQVITTTPEGWNEYHAETSAIKLSPDGKLLCVANRAFSLNNVACFAVDPRTGLLTAKSHAKLQGFFPRDFNFTPDGAYLLIGMQFSNHLELCRVRTDICELESIKLFEGVPRCNCIQFIKGGKKCG